MSILSQDANKRTQHFSSVRHNGIYDFFMIPVAGVFFYSYWTEAIWATNLALIITFSFCTFVQYKEKRYGNLLLYSTFFLFLLPTIFFGLFDPSLKYKFIDDAEERHVLLCLEIAIIGLYYGAVIKPIKLRLTGSHASKKQSTEALANQGMVSIRMQNFLKYAFIFCGLFSVLDVTIKAVFVQANSYLSYYTEFKSYLPYYMRWFSSVSPILFYFYLGSLPKKKDAMLPIALYLLVGVISLFYGQRNVFVIRMLVTMGYFFIRNHYGDEVWISKRGMCLLVVSIPAIIFLMGFWGSFRENREYGATGIWDGIVKALLDQGNNISILSFESRFRDVLPDKPFAIGGIISMLHNNIFARVLGVSQIPVETGTVEIALNGYSFSAALMYYENRIGFLLGFGIGSCYIAELFYSFGYLGVFLGSYLYGAILRKLSEFKLKSFIKNGFVLAMLQQMLMAPRAPYDAFISGTFQFANLFVAILCWFLSTLVWPVSDVQ